MYQNQEALACCQCARSLIFTASADVVIVFTLYEWATPSWCWLLGRIGWGRGCPTGVMLITALTGTNGANRPVKTLLFPPAAVGMALSPLLMMQDTINKQMLFRVVPPHPLRGMEAVRLRIPRAAGGRTENVA